MGFLLNVQSQLLCPHRGRAIGVSSATPRVLVGGVPALTSSGPLPIQGCSNTANQVVPTGRQHTVVAAFCLQAVATRASQRVT